MHTPPLRPVAALASLLALALGRAGVVTEAAAQEMPGGRFEWRTLNGRPAPAEFPPGSGTRLLAGTLELAAGPDGTPGQGRFALSFEVSVAGGAAAPQRVEGRFVSASGELRFVPDGGDGGAPVTFRYAWLPDGTLALTDALAHVWGYAPVD